MKFRRATKKDVPQLVKMIADDILGSTREQYKIPLPQYYYDAFEKIDKDPNQELIVAQDTDTSIIATLQLSFLQYLTYQGGIRAQIEVVRIRTDKRGQGLGKKVIIWAIERAKDRDAHMVQLTTDKKRIEALHFYEKLGFKPTHEGLKLHL